MTSTAFTNFPTPQSWMHPLWWTHISLDFYWQSTKTWGPTRMQRCWKWKSKLIKVVVNTNTKKVTLTQ